MKMIKNSLAIVGVVCVSGLFIFSMQKSPDDEATQDHLIGKENPIVNNYNVYALEMPENLNFAGEPGFY